MKKPTLIAAGVLVTLLAVFFFLQSKDDNAPTPPSFEVPHMADLDKIEIVNGAVAITLAREAGVWRLKAPVDFPVADGVQKDLDKLFAASIGMDRQIEPKEDLARYGLDKDTALITLHAGGAKKVAFTVGKEDTVDQTFVKRTWIKPEGGTTVFRAQAGLRSRLLIDLADLRQKKVSEFNKEDVVGVELSYGGKKISLAPTAAEGDKPAGWKSVEPAGESLDNAAIDRLIGAAGRLRADGFADGTSLADAGLQTPSLTATFKLKAGDPVTIMIGGLVKPAADAAAPPDGAAPPEPSRYLKLASADWIYTAKSFTIDSVDKRLADLRTKDMMTLDVAQVEKITAARPAEGERTEVVLEGGKWALVSPTAGEANKDLVDAALRTLKDLKAARVSEDVDAQKAGLGPDQATLLTLSLAGGEVRTVAIGGLVEEGKTDRYVRVGESGPIFELAGFQAEKLAQIKGDALTSKPVEGGGAEEIDMGELLKGAGNPLSPH